MWITFCTKISIIKKNDSTFVKVFYPKLKATKGGFLFKKGDLNHRNPPMVSVDRVHLHSDYAHEKLNVFR